MVDFRRGITALSVLALFAGLGVAQTNTGNTQLQCNTNVTVTPNLRGEGYTEQTGDITLNCTGGVTPSVGSQIPAVNITVFYNTQVTSRLLPTTASNSISEALLMIDEPGSGLPAPVAGFGPAAGQFLCSTPLQGCTEFVNTTTGSGIPVAVDAITCGSPGGTCGVGTNGNVINPATTPGRNVFQGVVNGNSVTFFGIPVLAPGTTSSRVYRITNVRVNANPLAGGSASGASPVQASISISGATSLLISNATPFVGFVTNGLNASVSGSTTLNQCASQTKASATTLRFAENFGTAFKTRVSAQTNTSYAGQISNPAQNVPGGIYNSESNFVFPAATGSNGAVAGLADFGTRLKATFNNIPTGVRVFVSTANVLNNQIPAPVPAVVGGSAANGGTTGYAQLVNGETTSDGTGSASGFFPSVTSTDNGPNNGNVPIVEVPITNGSGQAVWEVVNTNPSTNETFQFAVYVTYSANVAQNTPPAGTSTVNLSYAPTPPSFTASAGAAPSSTLSIPRFVSDASSARNIVVVQICRTILLYPYITNQAGFDTGIEIANTSLDPFTTGGNTTAAQSGSCRMTWYGGTTTAPTTPPGPSDTGAIAGGTIYVNTAQTLVPNFQGYMIAVCNFQYAHGFAFISDIGARNLAMGYLAVVLNDPGTSARSNANTTTSENGGH
ncbi:MAG: hypothetical protein JWP63_3423 [Candidatus Solibacter sp.]|nr:hypothetical protein [Candidatus Solibacter sp.]